MNFAGRRQEGLCQRVLKAILHRKRTDLCCLHSSELLTQSIAKETCSCLTLFTFHTYFDDL